MNVLGADASIGVMLLFAALLITAAVLVEKAGEKKRLAAWQELARRLRLEPRGRFDYTGTLGESQVRVDIYSRGSGKNKRYFTRFRIEGALPAGVTLSSETFFTRLSADISTGDPGFDHDVRVVGDQGLALALLDERMRRQLHDLVREGWKLEDGVWSVVVGRRLADPNVLERHLLRGTEIAAFTREAARSIPDRLRERVGSGSSLAIRKACLEHLIARFPGHRATEAALASAKNDLSSELQLVAAVALADVARLLRLACDRQAEPELRGTALRHAVRLDRGDRVRAALDRLSLDNAGAELPPPLAMALCQALTLIERPGAQATLVRLVASDKSEVQIEAIRALGEVGGIAAVQVLLPLRDRAFAFALASAAAAKDAILRIQARAGGGGAGALTLAEGDGGLAVVEQATEVSDEVGEGLASS